MGWKYIDDIVWEKQEGASINRNGNFFQMRKPVAYKPNIVTETIFIFQKPIDGLIDKVIKQYSDDVVKESLVEDGYERTNVWKFPPDTRSKHPAPYPTALSDRIIKYYSYKHDLVLDPFMGSGTTAVSAKNLDRRFVEEYAEERLAKVNPLAKICMIQYYLYFLSVPITWNIDPPVSLVEELTSKYDDCKGMVI